MIQGFLGTPCFEFLDRKTFVDREHARRSVAEWIDGLYSPRRRHSIIGNTRPVRFEHAWQMRRRRT